MPSTNTVNEHSFSALRRLKTKPSESFVFLHIVHKEHTDALSLETIADAFMGDNEHRLSVFGKFLRRA